MPIYIFDAAVLNNSSEDNNMDSIAHTTQRAPQISPENYVSREFAAKEKQNLWPKVWQVAGREEEIPNPGDFIIYDIADESIIVARAKDGGLVAYHNACPHRGRQLADACGHATHFRCKYHGWTFDLEGRNVQVQDRDDWEGSLDQENIDLHAVRVDTWGGFLWINMQPEGETLKEYLEVIPSYLDHFEYENMRFRWYLEVKLNCNWKVAAEAFMEGYHVAATHPQLLPVGGNDYTLSAAKGKHAHFGYWYEQVLPLGMPSPRLKQAPPADARPGVVEFFRQMEEDLKAIMTDRDYEASKGVLDLLPAEADPMTVFGTAVELGRQAALAEGTDYPAGLDFQTMGAAGADWHIFPNCITLPYFDGAIFYRARPNGDDPDSCIFNIWSLKRFAPGAEPKLERRKIDDVAGHKFGLIIDQDISNMVAVQKGMKSRAFRYAKPNPKQETELTNFHRVLEEYVLGQVRPLAEDV
jgi:phenylpropionate dioxygenase-like ring-hydroxylating dioxygenase large terminal subunit